VFVFTLADWQSNPNGTLNAVQTAFPNQLVIVRSSTIDEDNVKSLKAGYFHSESNVCTGSRDALATAIDRVIHSYSRDGRVPNQHDQVLVQPCIQEVRFSGVVLTRDPRLNAPYYVINYDSSDRVTDSVTKGVSCSLIRLARWTDTSTLENPWNKLVLALQEIEHIYRKKALDVEFAVDFRDKVHIFQVRPLLINKKDVGDEEVKSIVERLENEFKSKASKTHGVAGSDTIFCDMSDWNPAEMIGNRSNVFDYSLYRFVITKSIWNRARVSIGYTDVDPFELMVSFANKPYIDGRICFNSLTPRKLDLRLRKKLIDYYVHKLIEHPYLQDKVEFEVVFNCFEFSFDHRIPELHGNGFSKEEIDCLKRNLLTFTNDLLERSNGIIESTLKELGELGRRRSRIMKDAFLQSTPEGLLDKAFDLLADCKQLGTLPFSKVARLAFVGMIILKSMLREGIIDESFFYGFLGSIKTVVTEFRTDLDRLAHGDLSIETFLSRYGHLRPRTYDITAPRYDQTPNLFKSLNDSGLRSIVAKGIMRAADRNMLERMSKALLKSGLHCSRKDFLNFVRKTVQLREYSKFEFTKNISEALELIALAGLELGFSREELAMIDLDTLMQSRGGGKFDRRHVRRTWKNVAQQNQKKKVLYQKIALPPVITSDRDFALVQYYVSRPNFVTTKCVEGTVMDLSLIDYERIPDLSDKIIILENADPGYDWIFAHNLKGLITMYGGVASHMAIRCTEFGLPAAIGCGEPIFEKVRASKRIRLDCTMENIVPLY